MKFAGYIVCMLTYKVWTFGWNPYCHCWNRPTEIFLWNCFSMAPCILITQELRKQFR